MEKQYEDYILRVMQRKYDYKIVRLGTVAPKLGVKVTYLWTVLNKLKAAGKISWHERQGTTLFDLELLIYFPN